MLLALNMLDIHDPDEELPQFPSESADQERWLTCLAERIVGSCWQQPPSSEVRVVKEGFTGNKKQQVYPYCACRKGKSL